MNFGVRRYWKIWSAAFLLLVLTLVYFGFHYRAHVSSAFGWISEETGGTTMAVLTIALALLGLIYAFFCLIFPIIVYFGLKDVRRRLAVMAETMQTISQGKSTDRSKVI